MEPELVITFPAEGGFEARYKNTTLNYSDGENWHEGAVPSPFDLFVFSLGTCAASNMRAFMDNRDIPVDGARLVLRRRTDREKEMIAKFTYEVTLPKDFPGKYRRAIVRVVDACAVKRHVLDAPEFAVEIKTA